MGLLLESYARQLTVDTTCHNSPASQDTEARPSREGSVLRPRPHLPVLNPQGCENGPKGKEEGGLGRKEPLPAPLVNHRVLKEGSEGTLLCSLSPGLLLIPCHQLCVRPWRTAGLLPYLGQCLTAQMRGSLGEGQVPIRWNPRQAMEAKGGLRTRCLEEFPPPCPQAPWKERLSRAPPRPHRPDQTGLPNRPTPRLSPGRGAD